MKIRLMAKGRTSSRSRSASSRRSGAGRRARRRRSRLPRRQHQERLSDAKIGDTITGSAPADASRFPGFKDLKPMVFAGLYPVGGRRVPRAARRAREAAAERRVVLLRAGDVGGARLRLPLRIPRPAAHGDRPGAARARVRHGPGDTAPGVLYRVTTTDGDVQRDRQPGEAARRRPIEKIEEPVITAMILTPAEHVGAHPAAVPGQARRPEDLEYLVVGSRAHHLRAAVQRGRARLLRPAEDESRAATRRSTIMSPATGRRRSCKLDILVNGEPVDALSIIVHRDMAYDRGRALVERCAS